MTYPLSRQDHLKLLWAQKFLGKLITGTWAGIGVLLFIRDELWLPDSENQWRIAYLTSYLSLTNWFIIALVLVIFWVFESSYQYSKITSERLKVYEAESPIEVIFDTNNQQKRFWSIVPVVAADKTISHRQYQYSIAIKNNGVRTLRDVQVVSELTGELEGSPSFAKFELSGSKKTDLHPGEMQFVTIFNWPYPAIQAGMLADESAEWGYGKLKISVSATDMRVITRIFNFDYTKEPMLFNLPPSISTS